MPSPPLLVGKSIEGHAEPLAPWYDLDPLLQRTLAGGTLAGLLVGLCLARSRLFGHKPTPRPARLALENKAPSRKALTHASGGRARKGGALAEAARGLLVAYPSEGKKKRDAADAKRAKRRGPQDDAEEAMALAPRVADDAETFEDGLLALHGEPSPTYGRETTVAAAFAAAATVPPDVDEAQHAELDAEFEAIIAKHSTLRAASLRGAL